MELNYYSLLSDERDRLLLNEDFNYSFLLFTDKAAINKLHYAITESFIYKQDGCAACPDDFLLSEANAIYTELYRRFRRLTRETRNKISARNVFSFVKSRLIDDALKEANEEHALILACYKIDALLAAVSCFDEYTESDRPAIECFCEYSFQTGRSLLFGEIYNKYATSEKSSLDNNSVA